MTHKHFEVNNNIERPTVCSTSRCQSQDVHRNDELDGLLDDNDIHTVYGVMTLETFFRQ